MNACISKHIPCLLYSGGEKRPSREGKFETITFLKHFLSVSKSVYVLKRKKHLEGRRDSDKDLKLMELSQDENEEGKVKSCDNNRLNYLKA